VLDALAAAHERGVIHRDLKPENLFLTDDGRVKVLDFGIARLREGVAGERGTQTGTTMGTPAFMAPEQALGETSRVDGRTDVYAVGATMFTLLSGRIVHESETLQKLMLAAMTKTAPTLASVAPDADARVCALVDRALAFAQEDRWPSARDMLEAVRALRAGAPLAAPSRSIAGATPIASAEIRAAYAPTTPVYGTGAPVSRATGAPKRWGAGGKLAAAAGLGAIVAISLLVFRLVPRSASTDDGAAQAEAVPATAESPAPPPSVVVEPGPTAAPAETAAAAPGTASATASAAVPPAPVRPPRAQTAAAPPPSASPTPAVTKASPYDMRR
jgi:serine/threonine-protein kinase